MTEYVVLLCLISFINKNTTDKYEAYPSGDTIAEKTGLKLRTIAQCRKSLQDKGYIDITTGKGKGNSNRYTINVRKIVDAYNKSARIQITVEDDGFVVTEKKPTHQRNTSGLMKGKSRPMPELKDDNLEE